MKNPKNILVVSLSGIGNFIMQSPVFSVLKKQFPEAHITVWVAPRGTKILAKNHPAIDAVIEEPIQGSLFQHLARIQRLRRYRFDTGIVLSPGQQIKSAFYLWGAGIRHRIGHQYPFLNNDKSSFLLTNSLPEKENLHDIEQNLELLSLLNIPADKRSVSHYEVSIPSTYEQKAQALLEKIHIPSDRLLVGMHPGSDHAFLWKRWPVASFAQVGNSLIQNKKAFVLIFGGNHEETLKRDLYNHLKPNAAVINSDLLTGAAIMKQCNLFLSNDSGLMHLAAAGGVKTYGIFGPTDERHTGPRGKNSHVIRAPQTKPVYNTEKKYNLGTKTHSSLTELASSFVLEKLEHIK